MRLSEDRLVNSLGGGSLEVRWKAPSNPGQNQSNKERVKHASRAQYFYNPNQKSEVDKKKCLRLYERIQN